MNIGERYLSSVVNRSVLEQVGIYLQNPTAYRVEEYLNGKRTSDYIDPEELFLRQDKYESKLLKMKDEALKLMADSKNDQYIFTDINLSRQPLPDIGPDVKILSLLFQRDRAKEITPLFIGEGDVQQVQFIHKPNLIGSENQVRLKIDIGIPSVGRKSLKEISFLFDGDSITKEAQGVLCPLSTDDYTRVFDTLRRIIDRLKTSTRSS